MVSSLITILYVFLNKKFFVELFPSHHKHLCFMTLMQSIKLWFSGFCPAVQCSFSKLPGSTRWGGRVPTAPPYICSRQDGCQHVEGSVYEPVDSQSVPERDSPAEYRSMWCPLQSRYVQSGWSNLDRVCGCKGLGCWKRRVRNRR